MPWPVKIGPVLQTVVFTMPIRPMIFYQVLPFSMDFEAPGELWNLLIKTVINKCKFISNKVPGPRLNIKTVLSTYGDFHVKDKTAVRTSYL